MTNVGPSSLRQLAAAAAGQNAHPTNPASAQGDRLYMAGCYKNMYSEWTTALSQASQSPLNLTLLMKEVTAEVCSTPLAKGELLLSKSGTLLEVTSDGKRLDLDTREVCIATEDEFPIGRVHELYRRTVEKLHLHFAIHTAPTESKLITVQHLSMLQHQILKHYENAALETIWKQKLAAQLNQQNNPNLQTHEQIRAWLNDPNHAGQLQQIMELNLSNLGLKALPPEICSLTNLQTLNLYNNQLRSLPPEIGALRNLQTLLLSKNEIHSLPSEIGTLLNLQTLNLSNNQIHSLPTNINALSNLHTLNLNNNQLCFLPLEICSLVNLQELNLDINELRSLPPEIAALGNLLRLNLSWNKFSSLPSEIGALSKLQWLNLYNNQLRSLPAEICALTNLHTLSLSHNQLSSFPTEIAALSTLQTLNLNNNQLCSLPAEISSLSKLQMLSLTRNQLRSLPSEIGNLTNLKSLYVNNNQLQSLPTEISALTKLEIFGGITNNPWIFISDQELAKGPSIATFLQQNKEFAEYPTQSSLGNLFKLIARGEDAATIQNTFEELDSELQSKIIELANANVLVPVAASSNWTPSADENLFTDMPRLSRAVKKATMERFESLIPELKTCVYREIEKLAGEPKNAQHAFDNMLRFVDALETVTKK